MHSISQAKNIYLKIKKIKKGNEIKEWDNLCWQGSSWDDLTWVKTIQVVLAQKNMGWFSVNWLKSNEFGSGWTKLGLNPNSMMGLGLNKASPL